MTAEPSGSPALRVVVADDDPFTASLVAGALESQGFSVITASTVDQAWAAVVRDEPHALVTDLDFGVGPSGATLLEWVHRDHPWVGLVVLTSHQSPSLAVDNPRDMPEGCVYLVKSELRQIVDLAAAVHRSIAGQPAGDTRTGTSAAIIVTQAQAEVLRMLAHGASTRALAEHRGTTVRAAESMLARLFSTLGVADDERSNPRVEAVSLWKQGRVTVR